MQEEITIQKLSNENTLTVNYFDEDIVIIDDINTLAAPSTAKLAMSALFVVTSGKAHAKVNEEIVEVEKDRIVICPSNIGFSDILASYDFECKGIFFTDRVLQSFLLEKISDWQDLVYSRHVRVFHLTERHMAFYQHFYHMLRLCLEDGRTNPYFNDVVQALLRAAFLGISGELRSVLPEISTTKPGGADKVFRSFISTLGRSDIRHRTVASYAADLFVSPKYLSFVCKQNTGKTANELITERLTEEIRFCLEHTDLSVKQICYRLGFSTPSFFGKFVKAHFGMTPLQVRQSKREALKLSQS